MLKRLVVLLLYLPPAIALAQDAIHFPLPGSTSAPSGRGSFRFGAATAATQIEDQNTHTDWYIWTAPPPLGLGKSEFVDDAVMGYSKAMDDIKLLQDLHLDTYRFGIEWARIEPELGHFDESALKHYDDFINGLLAARIIPLVTLHHNANPIWVDDPREPADCPQGPRAENLCGFADPKGAEEVLKATGEYACMLGKRYGNRVDDWATINEPMNYLMSNYGGNGASPGRNVMAREGWDGLSRVLQNLIRFHIAIYDNLKRCDTIDADGDGIAASIGLPIAVVDYTPARNHHVSMRPDDIAAASRVRHFWHYTFVDAITRGLWNQRGGRAGMIRPDWIGKLDWIGVQYYPQLGVSAYIEQEPDLKGTMADIPGVHAQLCYGGLRQQACIDPKDPTHWVPDMQYAYDERGLFQVLVSYALRYPHLPISVTENGIATRVGQRRAEVTVRSLEQINRARRFGVDVRGYYHWSLLDNFEWGLGFGPKFGLYSVDRENFSRTPTEGATVYGAIANARTVTPAQRQRYGGTGPMTPEEGAGL